MTATTRAYFLSEGEDMRYEVKFGDNTAGRALNDGEIVVLEYLVTSGAEANEVSNFSFITTATDNGVNYSQSNTFTIETKDRSQLGHLQKVLNLSSITLLDIILLNIVLLLHKIML